VSRDPIKDDFRNFLFLVWEHLQLPAPTPLQYDIASYLQDLDEDRIMVQAFRGAAKSWISAAFALWWLYKFPNSNVVVVSASSKRADQFTTFMLRLIDEMPLLRHLRPREGQRRSMAGFDVGPAGITQTPSAVSLGINGQLTGNRADLIIADDVEVTNNSETLLMREKLKEKIKEFAALLKPGGRIVYLGTPQTEDTIYRELPERGYDVRVWPVMYPTPEEAEAYGDTLAPWIVDALEEDPKLAGQPVEPSRFNLIEIEKKRLEYGRAGFALQFMLDPRLQDADLYPLKLSDLIIYPLAREGPERVFWCSAPTYLITDLHNVGMSGDRWYRGATSGEPVYSPYQGTVMAIDPAGRGRDETGYAILSSLNGLLYLRASGGLKGYETKTLEALAELAKQYEVKSVVVEPNFGDGMFSSLLRPVFNNIYPCHIEEAERSNAQKEKRIIDTLGPVMESHRLVVDPSVVEKDYASVLDLPPEKAVHYRLFHQMTRITREKGCLNHDDRLDALALAVAYFQKAVSRDVATAAKEARERAKEKQLQDFIKSVKGRAKRRPRLHAPTGHCT
jgi:hypothetical protein